MYLDRYDRGADAFIQDVRAGIKMAERFMHKDFMPTEVAKTLVSVFEDAVKIIGDDIRLTGIKAAYADLLERAKEEVRLASKGEMKPSFAA